MILAAQSPSSLLIAHREAWSVGNPKADGERRLARVGNPKADGERRLARCPTLLLSISHILEGKITYP